MALRASPPAEPRLVPVDAAVLATDPVSGETMVVALERTDVPVDSDGFGETYVGD